MNYMFSRCNLRYECNQNIRNNLCITITAPFLRRYLDSTTPQWFIVLSPPIVIPSNVMSEPLEALWNRIGWTLSISLESWPHIRRQHLRAKSFPGQPPYKLCLCILSIRTLSLENYSILMGSSSVLLTSKIGRRNFSFAYGSYRSLYTLKRSS